MKNNKTHFGKKAFPVMLLVLCAALAFSACTTTTPTPTPTVVTTFEPTAEPTTEPTAEPTEAPVESPAAPAELPENAQGLASADEVTAFLDAVYAKVPAENLPMMLMHTPLDLSDMDAVTYNTGLTSVEGIDGIVVSESGTGSIAYSLVYIMTADGADADAIQAELLEKINPAKWICVSADQVISVRLGLDVLLVMGSPETKLAETVYNAVVETAEGVFASVGEKIEK